MIHCWHDTSVVSGPGEYEQMCHLCGQTRKMWVVKDYSGYVDREYEWAVTPCIPKKEEIKNEVQTESDNP